MKIEGKDAYFEQAIDSWREIQENSWKITQLSRSINKPFYYAKNRQSQLFSWLAQILPS